MLDGPAGAPLHATDPAQRRVAGAKDRRPGVAWASRDNLRLEAACAAAKRRAPLRRGRLHPFRRARRLVRAAAFARLRQPRNLLRLRAGRAILRSCWRRRSFPTALVERAARLRETLVAARDHEIQRRVAGRRDGSRPAAAPVVLVPGQVEDDASIQQGLAAAQAQHRASEGRARAPPGCVRRLQAASRRRGRIPPRPRARGAGARIRRPGRHEGVDPRPDRGRRPHRDDDVARRLRGAAFAARRSPRTASRSMPDGG